VSLVDTAKCLNIISADATPIRKVEKTKQVMNATLRRKNNLTYARFINIVLKVRVPGVGRQL
jgi:hypothetical protein